MNIAPFLGKKDKRPEGLLVLIFLKWRDEMLELSTHSSPSSMHLATAASPRSFFSPVWGLHKLGKRIARVRVTVDHLSAEVLRRSF
jgi:hypothetical protein